MTLEQAQLFIVRNSNLNGSDLGQGFICGSLWIVPLDQKGLQNSVNYYSSMYCSQAAALPCNYTGEVGVIAVDLNYLNQDGDFNYQFVAK